MAKTNSTPMFSYSKPYPFQASLPAFKNTVWVTLSLLSSEESGFNFRIGVCTKSNYSNRRIEAGLGRIFRSAICSFTFSIHQGGATLLRNKTRFPDISRSAFRPVWNARTLGHPGYSRISYPRAFGIRRHYYNNISILECCSGNLLAQYWETCGFGQTRSNRVYWVRISALYKICLL